MNVLKKMIVSIEDGEVERWLKTTKPELKGFDLLAWEIDENILSLEFEEHREETDEEDA